MTNPKTFRNQNLDHFPYMEEKTHLRTSGLQPTSWRCFGGSWEQDHSQPSTDGSLGIAKPTKKLGFTNKKAKPPPNSQATWVWCMFHALI